MLTQERLKEVLNYDSETGEFVWSITVNSRAKKGDVAGWNDGYGYRRVTIDGTRHRSHRIAWLYIYGAWPDKEIDHINGDRSDNRIANLRLATRSENMQNLKSARRDSRSGLIGARFHKASRKWVAEIKLGGKSQHLGCFMSKEDAHAAYMTAKASIHIC